MSYWIPCWVTMPKREHSSPHSEWVLITADVRGVRVVWFAQYGFLDRTWWDPEGRPVPGVTAWRELPDPFDKTQPRPFVFGSRSAVASDQDLSDAEPTVRPSVAG